MQQLADFLPKAIVTTGIIVFFLIFSDIVFRRLFREREKAHLLFLQRFIRWFLIILLIMLLVAEYWGFTRLGSIIAGSVAIIGGIIGFAAQSVLRDFFAGLMISVYRPFDIGDRVILASTELPCVVEELTMRHTVLKTMDGIRYVIPNSKLGEEVITNTSYRQSLRGSYIKVPVSYDTDLNRAVILMREAIRQCPYTLPNNPNNQDLGGYGDVYLMGFDSSSLMLQTVIWTEPQTDNFLACSEVRELILRKFRANHVEIPYSYINVVEKGEASWELRNDEEVPEFKKKKRNTRIRTDTVELRGEEADHELVLEKADRFGTYYMLEKEKTNTIRLLSEELLLFACDVTGQNTGKFWIEGNRDKIRVCVKTRAKLDREERAELLLISSSGKNEGQKSFVDFIREAIYSNDTLRGKRILTLAKYKEQAKKNGEGLERLILDSVSDNIKVEINGEIVLIIAIKDFKQTGGKE